VIERVCTNAAYPVAFDEVWEGACEIDWPADVDAQCGMEGGFVGLSEQDRDRVDTAYDSLGLTVAAYEASSEVNQFSSKFDAYRLGLADLSRQEKKGLSLFKGKGKCSRCHSVSGPPHDPPLFTDFSYDNLGVPRNPENPFYTMPPEFNPLGMDWIDLGLGGFLETRDEYQDEADDHYGAQKVPTLRNVDKRPNPEFPKAYAHNGYFKTLEGIVHFYNTRDVKPTCPNPFTTEEQALSADCWPEPEMPLNVNDSELGDLGLSSEEEVAIVAFLKTLSDGWLGSD
jgi:cytochrome c peroxidase